MAHQGGSHPLPRPHLRAGQEDQLARRREGTGLPRALSLAPAARGGHKAFWPMMVAVFGAGYVGLVTAACLADIGHQVVCVDVDERRVGMLAAAEVPFHEDGLPELVRRHVASARLDFTCDASRAIVQGEVIFIATGTPTDSDGSADLAAVLDVGRSIGRHMDGAKVVVVKSTVPVGGAARLREAIETSLREREPRDRSTSIRATADALAIVANPEFLRQGMAILDFMHPDRIVIGVEPGETGRRARDTMARLYAPVDPNGERTLHLDIAAAEFSKYASNAMLATRISFMNE
ncbi:MAG: nucleotide sugar dehydrogenase, partial [Comamonadaceae bacterium]